MIVRPTSLSIAAFLVVLLVLCPLIPVWAAGDTSLPNEPQASEGQPPVPVSPSGGVDIYSGLPKVTTQQAIAKSQRITAQIYELTRSVALQMTLIAICVAAILSIFWRQARVAIPLILLGYAIVEWGPQLLGWFRSLLHA